MKTPLSTPGSTIESREQDLLAKLPREQAEAVALTMSHIRQQYDVLSLCTELFIDLANVMSNKLAASSESNKREEELRQILQRIEGYSQGLGPH
jgi:K+-sensing histidine kinase KdpD